MKIFISVKFVTRYFFINALRMQNLWTSPFGVSIKPINPRFLDWVRFWFSKRSKKQIYPNTLWVSTIVLIRIYPPKRTLASWDEDKTLNELNLKTPTCFTPFCIIFNKSVHFLFRYIPLNFLHLPLYNKVILV